MSFIQLSILLRNGQWKKQTFLHVSVRSRNRQLETDLRIKPTDTLQLLDSRSCHPYHCIPYSQDLRYYRICSDNEKFDQHCNDYKE